MKLVPVTFLLLTFSCSRLWAQNRWNAAYSGQLTTTAEAGNQRWETVRTPAFQAFPQPKETDVCIFVDPDHQFQSILGFGGAIADASAETFAALPAPQKAEILRAYYDKQSGLGYNIVRTNIGSCDFSSDSYTYVQDQDATLKSFSIAHDEKFRIPFLQQAKAAIGKDFTLFVSPWSPPAWMKDNNSLSKGGHLKKEYYATWADYLIRYIKALESKNLPVWGMTIQNEAMATQIWESCVYTAEEERDFLKNALGPSLWKNGMKNKKVIIWDHNRDLVYQYASTILNDPEAAKYVWGTGIHWYETWTKSLPLYANEKLLQEAFPDKALFFTEGCIEQYQYERLNDRALGERYGTQILHDLNNGVTGWTDWNILLDMQGGPNHVGNYCFAPIHADPATGTLHYTNIYWYIGQFSRFIRPQARRVVASSNRDKLQTTAFLNKDGHLSIVVLNTTDEEIPYKLWIKGKAADGIAGAHSIATWEL